MKTKLFTLSLAGLIGTTAFAQQALSLKQAQEYAAEHSYAVQNKQMEVDKARKTILETTAIGLPQVNFNAGYTYNSQLAQTPVPAEFFGGNPGELAYVAFGVTHQSQANLQLDQLIFDGSYFVALVATRVFKEIKANEKEQAIVQVREQVAQAYHGALLTRESARVLEENLASLEESLKQTTALYNSGFTEEQDVEQLEFLVGNLRNSLENARRNAEISLKMLKFAMGMPLDQEISLADNLNSLIQLGGDGTTVLAQNFNLEQHIDYRTVDSQERGAQLQVRNLQMGYLPKISGFIQHGETNFSNDDFNLFNWNTYWIPSTAMGLSFRWEIFTSFRRTAGVQKAKIDLDMARLGKQQISEGLRLEFEQAKSDYLYALENQKTQKRNLELSESIRNKTRIKFQEGISSSLDLTQAENQYLETESQYLQALYQTLNAKARMDKVLGNYNTSK